MTMSEGAFTNMSSLVPFVTEKGGVRSKAKVKSLVLLLKLHIYSVCHLNAFSFVNLSQNFN